MKHKNRGTFPFSKYLEVASARIHILGLLDHFPPETRTLMHLERQPSVLWSLTCFFPCCKYVAHEIMDAQAGPELMPLSQRRKELQWGKNRSRYFAGLSAGPWSIFPFWERICNQVLCRLISIFLPWLPRTRRQLLCHLSLHYDPCILYYYIGQVDLCTEITVSTLSCNWQTNGVNMKNS